MTEDEARKLAQRIIDTWPSGTKGYIWRDLLLPLDPHAAAQAYRAMLDEAQKAPTPARLKEHYGALTRRDRSTMIRWNGNEIGLDEYLERLALRTDQDSTDEHDNWKRWLAPKAKR